MPLIIPAGYLAASVRFSSSNYTDGFSFMTFGVHQPGTGTLSETAVIIADALLESDYQAVLADDVTADLVEVWNDTSTGAATMALTGEQTQPMPPPNVACLVEKRTAVRGRRAAGRFFLPSIVQEGAIDERGNIATDLVGLISTRLNDFLERIEDADAGMVILQNSEGISPPLDTPPNVNSLIVDPMVSTMRRRLRR